MSEENLSIEQIESKMYDAYDRYMYEEAAERGYNAAASQKAFSEYLRLKMMLEKMEAE